MTYHWIDPNKGTDNQIGFIAQDVQKVIPEVVHTDPSTTYESVDYAKFAPVLVGSIQELNAKVDAQQKNRRTES